MPSMYDKLLDGIHKEFQVQLTALSENRNLIDLVDKLTEMWSNNHEWFGKVDANGRKSSFLWSGHQYWREATLRIWLGPEDSLGGDIIGELFDTLVYNDYFEDDVQCVDSDDADLRTWTFQVKKGGLLDQSEGKMLGKLIVQAYVRESKACRMVGTGKFKEIMRLECGTP